jgi:lipopolysaccharide/colanic/teichoic acid biosynthesis glycosyltransferase
VIDRERGRAERAGGEFSVVAFALPGGEDRPRILARLSRALARRVRRTDAVGWLDADRLGVVLAATGAAGAQGLADKTALRLAEQGWPVAYTLYVFPQKWSVPGRGDVDRAGGPGEASAEGGTGALGEARLEPLLATRVPFWKRATDIIVSAAALVALSPLLLLAAVVIRLVSPGPALFRQKRIGRGGRPFVLLKLRSMTAGSDPGVHRRHLAGLIGSDRPMSKLAGDGRVFALGRMLRRTCIDELPQLVNVLWGEMSLVGPRPCLPYEAEEYSRWHSRRFDLAPGMTGLWQVSGKDRLSFPEMVRLDIAYARTLSPWLDMKILLKTPLAVLAGLLPRRRGAEGSPR